MCNRFSKNLGLRAAAKLSAATGLLSINGWLQIPLMISGVERKVIFQWGFGNYQASDGVTGTVITFPVAFPSAGLRVLGVDAGTSANSVSSTSITTTGFTAIGKAVATGALSSAGISYLAIGY